MIPRSVVFAVSILLTVVSVRTESSVPSASSALAPCPPLSMPAPAYARWDEDAGYQVVISRSPAGMKVRVVGDLLRITSGTMDSLIRDIDQPLTGLSELTLDARIIEIDAPVSIRSGTVRLLAESIVFGPRGVLSWTGEPDAAGDGLELHARTLTLDRSMPRPFDLLTSATPQRRVYARAASVVEGGKSLTGADAQKAFWRKTAENFGDENPGAPRWDIQFDDSALDAALAVLKKDATWPHYFTFKLQQHFSRDPFGPNTRGDLLRVMRANIDPLVALEASDALAVVHSIEALIASNLDMAGAGPAFVPRRDVINALDSFDRRTQETLGLLPTLRDLILQSYDNKAPDAAALAAVRKEALDLGALQKNIEAALTQYLTELEVNEAEVVEQNRQIAEVRAGLAKRLEKLKERAEDAEKTRIATTALSVGAAFIPAAGPFISAGIAATGQAIYAHNTKGASARPAETFVSAAKKGADFYAATKGAQASWEAHRSDLQVAQQVWQGNPPAPEKPGDKPMTRTDAAQRTAKSAAAFASSVKAMVDLLQDMPAPTRLTMNDLERDDPLLQSQIAKVAELRSVQAALADKIAVSEKERVTAQARASVIASLEDTILTASPQNDADQLRWRMAATQLWRLSITERYSEALILRRAAYFETGKVFALPAEVYQFPEETLVRQAQGVSTIVDLTPTRESTQQFLDLQMQQHRAALVAISGAAKTAFSQYAAQRGGGGNSYLQTFKFTSASTDSEVSRNFVGTLNRQIRTQMRAAGPGSSGVSAVLIPIVLPTPPLDAPERLLAAAISDIQFKSEPDLQAKFLNFDLSYQLAGEVRRAGKCAFVDMREAGADSGSVIRVEARDVKTLAQPVLLPPTFMSLSQYYAAPLARTFYYLRINVDGDRADASWKRIPEVKSLSITLRVVQ